MYVYVYIICVYIAISRHGTPQVCAVAGAQGLAALLDPLEKAGILVKRSREELEDLLPSFTVRAACRPRKHSTEHRKTTQCRCACDLHCRRERPVWNRSE